MGRGRERQGKNRSTSSAPKKGYVIEYSPEAADHTKGLRSWQQRLLKDAIEGQLRLQPTKRTGNRKPLRSNPLAPWELRVGDLRVYYDVGMDPVPTVFIRAVGVKEHSTVLIGGEAYRL